MVRMAKPLAALASHDERVGVVEAKLRRHADASFRQFRAASFPSEMSAILQNFFRNSAGIFGIEVDLPAAQSFPENDRSAHALAMFDGDSGLVERVLRDFGKDIGFGKFLRADDDRRFAERPNT